jgi:hypothetical protein
LNFSLHFEVTAARREEQKEVNRLTHVEVSSSKIGKPRPDANTTSFARASWHFGGNIEEVISSVRDTRLIGRKDD